MDEKLLKWCNENYDFDAQKWTFESIPEEILDCVEFVMKQWWPQREDDFENDFITDFICSQIVCSKIWKITKLWLKEACKEQIENLFD